MTLRKDAIPHYNFGHSCTDLYTHMAYLMGYTPEPYDAIGHKMMRDVYGDENVSVTKVLPELVVGEHDCPHRIANLIEQTYLS